jgi:hypothetical protein
MSTSCYKINYFESIKLTSMSKLADISDKVTIVTEVILKLHQKIKMLKVLIQFFCIIICKTLN